MLSRTSRVRVKVCGTTCLEDALAAVEAGADALGFIFYKKSPRNIAPKEAKEIIAALPPFVETVGVFVNEKADRINRIAESCRLGAVQLHGDETPAFCKRIKRKVIKAVRVKDLGSLKRMPLYTVSAYLLDAWDDNLAGGTGKIFDWNLVHRAKKYGPVILAGGLNSGNVQAAVGRVKPYGVDVCSGVEQSPGKKDPQKIINFIKVIRGY